MSKPQTSDPFPVWLPQSWLYWPQKLPLPVMTAQQRAEWLAWLAYYLGQTTVTPPIPGPIHPADRLA